MGSKAVSKTGTGWVFLLAPTVELWTLVLRHRTQILYLADIATICFQLELRPGSIVLESGTGSGSLTHSLARAVAPSGHIHTFEFHEERATMAAQEFKSNGFEHLVTVQQRNIEELGFPEEQDGRADAVFLDLPGPWKAIPLIARSLRPDGVFCGFSPCIEQVQKTCEALNQHGFRDFRTIEILLREYEVGVDMEERGDEKLEEMLREQEEHAAGEESQQRGGGREKREKKRGRSDGGDNNKNNNNGGRLVGKKVVISRPLTQGRGHTGYLTFARKAPL